MDSSPDSFILGDIMKNTRDTDPYGYLRQLSTYYIQLDECEKGNVKEYKCEPVSDDHFRALIDANRGEVMQTLAAHKEPLKALALALIEKQVLTTDEIYSILLQVPSSG
jgi:ATP-dependent Zn protease